HDPLQIGRPRSGTESRRVPQRRLSPFHQPRGPATGGRRSSPGRARPQDPTAASRGRLGRPSEDRLGPFELLQRQIEQLVKVAGLPPRARRYASLVAWAAMHGLTMLALDGQLERLSNQERDEVVDRLVRMVEAGLLAG